MSEGRGCIVGAVSKRRRAVSVALGVMVIAVLGLAMVNRFVYGGFNPWSPPERLEWCGAHFYRTGGGDPDPEAAAPMTVAVRSGGQSQPTQSPDSGAIAGTLGDGAVVTRAEALRDSSAGTLVAHGTIGLLGTWKVFVPGGFQCPQHPDTDQLNGFMFVELGPDRYLEMTDID